MALLTLLRHGQSTYNAENRFTGFLDVPLTNLGIKEAHLAGQKLKNYHFDFAFTSMLVRAWQTLDIVLDEINQNEIPIVKNMALNERHYGALQGLNKTETGKKYGEKQVEIWRRSFEIKPPDGESLQDTFRRTIPFYCAEIEPNLRLNKNVLIVAHGNSLRALTMYLENISTFDIVNINIPTGIPRNYIFDDMMTLVSSTYLFSDVTQW